MKPEQFDAMSHEQKWSMVIAYAVRNALEPFHAGPDGLIPDTVMPELNRRVRRAIFTTVYSLMHIERPGCEWAVGYHVCGIPEAWEVPELLPEEKALLDDGYHDSASHAAYEQLEPKLEAWYKTGKYGA